MIEEVTMYGMRCDACGESLGNGDYDYVVFSTEIEVRDEASCCDWLEIDGKWYCPDCVERLFEYDEDKDIWTKKEQG